MNLPLMRWESKGGAHWVELYSTQGVYYYRSTNGGGTLPRQRNNAAALALMESRVEAGEFLPDKAVVPMHRVPPSLG